MIIDWIICSILMYFVVVHGGNLLLNFLALYGMRRIDQAKVLADLPHIHSGLEPPISMLLTTRDQASNIAASVRTLLELNYPQFEVIVVNDGSQDDTMQVLTEEFELLPFPEAYRIQLPTQGVTSIYRSIHHPNLRVIDQSAGGRADALNAAINAARFPLVCSMETNIVLERDCLHRIVMPFLGNADTIAAIGAIRLSGDDSENGLLARLQNLQHLRRNLFAQLGWSLANALLVASPGIHLLRKDIVIQAGGYHPDALYADQDLIMRMHVAAARRVANYRIRFVNETIGFRKACADVRLLKKSSVQTQRALANSMHRNVALLSGERSTMRARAAFLFVSLGEWFGPAIEVASYVVIVGAFLAGFIPASTAGAFFAVAIGLGILVSMSSVLLEEISVQTDRQSDDAEKLILSAVVENLGYRQIDAYWRTLGLMQSRSDRDQSIS